MVGNEVEGRASGSDFFTAVKSDSYMWPGEIGPFALSLALGPEGDTHASYDEARRC